MLQFWNGILDLMLLPAKTTTPTSISLELLPVTHLRDIVETILLISVFTLPAVTAYHSVPYECMYTSTVAGVPRMPPLLKTSRGEDHVNRFR